MQELVEDVHRRSENMNTALRRAIRSKDTQDPERKLLEEVFWNKDEDESHVWCDCSTDEGTELAVALFERFYGFCTSQGHYVEYEKS